MASMTIDGKTCEFEGKPAILEVALDHGIEIPHYCWHPGLAVVASCRICLAEVAQPNPRNNNKVELLPKLQPTCQTPAADGMVVHTKSPSTLANQKAVMEYLLINHPLDCPVCDQAGECYLQDYSYKYGRSESRFEENKIKQPKKDLGPYVMLYADRCIMCSRCVRFTKEVTGTGEIGIFGRGSDEQIDIFPGQALDNELSGNVIDICPVGALLDKDFLMSMRVWNLQKTPSIDGLTASGDNISIEHHDGQIYRVKPRTNMEVNKWWTSDEIRFGWRFIHREDRLRSPVQNCSGTSTKCDWKQAYDQVSRALTKTVEQSGLGSLGLLISPMLPCEEAHLLAQWILDLDRKALIGIGPVPVKGRDKTFPGKYTVRAEKCPNRRGVERILDRLTDIPLSFEQWVEKLADSTCRVATLVLTGNYPSDWVEDGLVKVVEGRFTVLIDTLPNRLTSKADVVLPAATWAEKSGTFENVERRLQCFSQAVPVIEMAKTEGQIALDLMAAAKTQSSMTYDAQAVREHLGDEFLTDVHHPPQHARRISDMQYVEL